MTTEPGANQNKEYWEIKEIRQKLQFNKITLIITFITIAGSIIGYFIDSSRTREQRNWEARQNLQTVKIKRMTDIATEFNELLGATVTALLRAKGEALLFNLSVETLSGEIKESKIQTENSKQVQAVIDSFLQNLAKEELDVTKYAYGIVLQEKWKIREKILTPDFEILFGKNLAKTYPQISGLAWEAINSKYNYLADDKPILVDSLERIGSRFQSKLAQRIFEESSKIED